MARTIHDDVREVLQDLSDELEDLERVAGHELVRLHDSLRATVQAIRAARRGQGYAGEPIEAGRGAIEDPLHPDTAAAEVQPESAVSIAERAEREPDATVRANMLADAARRESDSTDPDAGPNTTPDGPPVEPVPSGIPPLADEPVPSDRAEGEADRSEQVPAPPPPAAPDDPALAEDVPPAPEQQA